MATILESLQAAEAADSNRLPVLAASLKANVARLAANRQDWVEIELAIGVELVEVRSRFPLGSGDADFSKWLSNNKIDIEKNRRAAYIAMGQDPARMRQVLEATERTSIRHIFASDWAVPHVGNRSQKPQKSPFPHAHQMRATVDKALEVIRRRVAAGESLSYSDIQKESGVSDGSVTAARAAYQAEQDALAGAAKVEDLILSGSAQDRFDAKLKAFKKAYKAQLDAEYQAKLTAAVNKWAEEYRIPSYLKEIADMRKMLDMRTKRGGALTRADYRKILSCLHPDTHTAGADGIVTSNVSPEKLLDAFRVFKDCEDAIVMDANGPRVSAIYGMPFTQSDLLRRKAKT